MVKLARWTTSLLLCAASLRAVAPAAAATAAPVPASAAGLLAARVPGGAAYAGVTGEDHLDGLLAADRNGRIAVISLGSARTLLSRLAALRGHVGLLVADLPPGAEGLTDLRALSGSRS